MREIIDVIAAIIQRSDGKILIAKRGAESKLAHKWEFPGGKPEAGENDAQCLCREICEELGVNVIVGKHFHTVTHKYPWGTIRLASYFCRLVSGEPIPTVHSDIRWVFTQELMRYDFAPADIPIVKRLSARR